MTGPAVIWCGSANVTARDASLAVVPPGLVQTACEQASDLAYALSGRRFPGTTSLTVRPSARPSAMTIRQWSLYLQTLSGVGTSLSWAAGGGWFGSQDILPETNQIDLGAYPVTAIKVVKIDGVVIPEDEYRVDDFRYLVRCRHDAAAQPTQRAGWPRGQNMALPDTEPGTFSVAFEFGEPPPAGGVTAATTLAVELARMYAGSANRLPARIQSITRQGVSFAMLDPMTFLEDGLTGLYDVDLWIRSVNPGKHKAVPLIWSPDLETRRRPTGGLI